MVKRMNYYYGIDDRSAYLYHYGVKGMKWGVRKQRPTIGQRIGRHLQTEGYRNASLYEQRRGLKSLSRQKSTMSRSQYRQKRREVIHRERSQRGQKLVENNQTYAKVIAKGVAKTAAAGVGAAYLASRARSGRLPGVAGFAAGYGIGTAINTAVKTGQRVNEIRTYKKGNRK